MNFLLNPKFTNAKKLCVQIYNWGPANHKTLMLYHSKSNQLLVHLVKIKFVSNADEVEYENSTPTENKTR